MRAVRSCVIASVGTVCLCACGFGSTVQGARLTATSDQACADKVALAVSSSQPVTGAWDCLDATMRVAYTDLDITSDAQIPENTDPDRYMETVKFVGHRDLQGSTLSDARWLLYRAEGHPNGTHVVGYEEIEIDPSSGKVHSVKTTYCKPLGDLACDGLPT